MIPKTGLDPEAKDIVHEEETNVVATTESNVSRMALGASISLFGIVIARGLEFVKQVAMARLLGPQSFGLFALGWNTLRLAGILATLGLHTGVMNYGTAYWRRDGGAFRSIITRSILLSFFVGWILTLILILIAPWLTDTIFNEPDFLPLFRIFSLMLPFLGALRVAATATRISKRMQFSIIAEDITQSAINLVLFALFYILGWQLFGAIISTVISFIIALGVAVYFIWQLFGSTFSEKSKILISNRELLVYSAPTAIAEMSGAIILRIDRLFLGYYRPPAEVGIYQAASQISVIMAATLYAFNMILMPMISEQFHSKDMKQLEELFRVNTKWGIYATIPLVLIIGFAAKEVMVVLFGAEYVLGSTALIILTVGQFINIATGATATILIMTGYQSVWFRLSLAAMVMSLSVNNVLIPSFGINGAAIATSLTISIQFIVGLLIIRRKIHIWPYDRRYLKGALATLFTSTMLIFMSSFGLQPLAHLVLITIVAIIGFFGCLLFFGLDPEDRSFIMQIAKRFSR